MPVWVKVDVVARVDEEVKEVRAGKRIYIVNTLVLSVDDAQHQ